MRILRRALLATVTTVAGRVSFLFAPLHRNQLVLTEIVFALLITYGMFPLCDHWGAAEWCIQNSVKVYGLVVVVFLCCLLYDRHIWAHVEYSRMGAQWQVIQRTNLMSTATLILAMAFPLVYAGVILKPLAGASLTLAELYRFYWYYGTAYSLLVTAEMSRIYRETTGEILQQEGSRRG